jgi:hypothetical protein
MKTKGISDFIINKNIFAGCEVHGGGNEFYRSARRRRVEKAHLGRTNCDCHSVESSETCFFNKQTVTFLHVIFLIKRSSAATFIIIVLL